MDSTALIARKPRYQALADDLRAQIRSGALTGGAAFPTETVLCARYKVSRFTVREALRQLQHDGLIQRRRGSGTVIQPAAARGGALHQPLSNVAEILQYARDTEVVFEALPPAPLPARLSAEMGLSIPGKWPRFRGVRTRGSTGPIALTEVHLHPDLAAIAGRIEPQGATIFRQIEALTGARVAQVTQDIQAVAATAAVAAALGLTRRAPCLRIVRCFLDAGGRVLEVSVSHHPGDRFAYAMHIEVEA
ncbi:MAG: GntR family transcriptional regulator [Sphingomonadaceae bacterium]|nr:GntR family transcriptional regulator [Sphingomonadaceae bacterium]